MKYRPLGASGIQASVIGFGAWPIGGLAWVATDEAASQDAVRTAKDAVHAALDLGVTLIDTAPMYGFGLAEDIIGRAIEGRRDEVVLATKCGLAWEPKEYVEKSWDLPAWNDLSRKSIMREVERSLVRLRTDRIDLYQTHWPDPKAPIEETMETLLELKAQGKIRAIGASNVSPEQMDQYRALGVLDTDQEMYSMLDRRIEASQVPYCLKHGVAILAYSPLMMGLLSGKVSPDRVFPEGDIRGAASAFSRQNILKVNSMLDDMKPVAEKHGINITQLVLAWTAEQPGITHVLSGIRNPAQALENCAAGDVELSEEDLAAIGAAIEKHGYGPLDSAVTFPGRD